MVGALLWSDISDPAWSQYFWIKQSYTIQKQNKRGKKKNKNAVVLLNLHIQGDQVEEPQQRFPSQCRDAQRESWHEPAVDFSCIHKSISLNFSEYQLH